MSRVYDRLELLQGTVQFSCPAILDDESIDVLEAWFALRVRNLRRRIPEDSIAPICICDGEPDFKHHPSCPAATPQEP
jgi:hypothetical protein